MKSHEILIAHPQTHEQVTALKAFMKALKIEFQVTKPGSYDPVFVEKVLESRQQAKKGMVTRVEKENLKEFLGL